MINKFQTGGQLEQIISYVADFLLQNGQAQDEQSALESAQQLVEAAQAGDQEAQAALQEIMSTAQNAAPAESQVTPLAARLGAKLNYIRQLKGMCPPGEELVFFKAGGRICKACSGQKLQPGGFMPKPTTKSNLPKSKPAKPANSGYKEYNKNGIYVGANPVLKGKTRKDVEAMQKKNRADARQGKGEGVPTRARGGILINKGTAFGDGTRGANPRNTDHGGHRSHGNTKAASYMKKTNIPNKFTAFGDEGKKKPTNVGLVGHTATGKTGRMQSKQTVSDNVNKHTAFGAHINKTHRQAKASSVGGWKKLKNTPKGHGGSMGWKKYANGGSLNGIPFFNREG